MSAEEWVKALNDTVKRYRARLGGDLSDGTLSLEQALEKTRSLHLSDGEAMRYLASKK